MLAVALAVTGRMKEANEATDACLGKLGIQPAERLELSRPWDEPGIPMCLPPIRGPLLPNQTQFNNDVHR